jgi:hypothetical protein
MNFRTIIGRTLIGLLIVVRFIGSRVVELLDFLDDADDGILDTLTELGYEVTEQ